MDITEQEHQNTDNQIKRQNTPPMTAYAYKQSFEEQLQTKVIKRSIDKSNEAVKTFLQNELQKLVKHCGSQTMSIDELFEDYNQQIQALEKKMKGAAQREQNLMNELTRISDMLKDARNLEQRWKFMAQEQEEEYDKIKYLYSTSDRTIKELQDQIAAINHNLLAAKFALKR